LKLDTTYKRALIAELLDGLSCRYEDLLELQTVTKDATVADVAHPKKKL